MTVSSFTPLMLPAVSPHVVLNYLDTIGIAFRDGAGGREITSGTLFRLAETLNTCLKILPNFQESSLDARETEGPIIFTLRFEGGAEAKYILDPITGRWQAHQERRTRARRRA